ncbi:hypothetical protein PVAP13_7KG419584, partial [Panicum virgatum]
MTSFIMKEIDNYWQLNACTDKGAWIIHKVPQHIRGIDNNCYEPVVLSIGPYHNQQQALLPMEKEKWKCLDFILKVNCKRSLLDYIKIVFGMESQVRKCYSADTKLTRKQFVQMLLLDACFILVKVDGTIQRVNPQHMNNDNTVGDWYSNAAWHDLFLLENQIPLFVISSVFKLAVGESMESTTVAIQIAECVDDILRQFPKAAREPKRLEDFHHLLMSHVLQTKPPTESPQNMLPTRQIDCFQGERLPSLWRQATHYHKAGVQLKRRYYNNNDRHSLLDIRFSRGVVEFPCFPIDENTESLFKNLIAFEQADPRFGDDVTAYIAFMSHLLTSPDDATLLVQEGIIVHMLDSDDDISALFTRLTKQITFDSESNYYLKPLCLVLEAHYQSKMNRWMAWLWLNHFSNPWLALAVLAAVIMLLCTVIQTYFTVLAYVQLP